MESITLLIVLIAGSAMGGFVGYYFRKLFAAREVDSAERRAENLINEAKDKQKQILLKFAYLQELILAITLLL